MNVLIVGASRGIGFEFVRQYRSDGASVTATARDDDGLARLREAGASALRLDVTDAASVAGLAWPADGAGFDVAIVVAGVIGERAAVLVAPSQADFDHVMHANVLGAMRVLPQLVDALAPRARLAVMSSRMASIGERDQATNWLYRASKAALNSVLKDTSIALEGRAICVALHPGWVRTAMGGDGAELGVAESVADQRRTLAGLTGADNGKFLDHDGTVIAW